MKNTKNWFWMLLLGPTGDRFSTCQFVTVKSLDSFTMSSLSSRLISKTRITKAFLLILSEEATTWKAAQPMLRPFSSRWCPNRIVNWGLLSSVISICLMSMHPQFVRRANTLLGTLSQWLKSSHSMTKDSTWVLNLSSFRLHPSGDRTTLEKRSKVFNLETTSLVKWLGSRGMPWDRKSVV